MAKYHPSSPLFTYLNNKYKINKNGVNYANLLYSMRDKSSIEDLIPIYDEVLEELIIYLYGEGYFDKGKWYSTFGWTERSIIFLNQLNYFLNDEIYRIFRNNEVTHKSALKAIVNFRPSDNYDKKIELITKQTNKIHKFIQASHTIWNVPENLVKDNCNKKFIFPKNNDYKKAMNLLVKYGYIKSIRDRRFEKDWEQYLKKNSIYVKQDTSSLVFGIIGFLVIIILVILLWPLIKFIITIIPFAIIFRIFGFLLI